MVSFQLLKGFAWCGLLVHAASCVPLVPSPPATPLSSGNHQAIGLQNDVIFPLQEAGAQAWYRRALDEDSEFFVQVGALIGYGIFPYAGGGYRKYWVQPDPVKGGLWSVGGEVSGGVGFWGQLGVPVSRKLGSLPAWLTTHPSVGYSNFGMLHVPLGLNVRLSEGVQLNTQAGVWLFHEFSLDDPRVYATAGLSFPW